MQIVTKVELRQKVWIYKKKCDILLDKERDDMKRAIYISILCTVMLTACGNVSESTKRAETSEVSQTTTTLTTSAATAKEEKDTSETTTTKKSLQTVSETSSEAEISKVKTTNKNTVGSLAVSMHTPQEQTQQQSYSQAEQQFQETTQEITTQQNQITTKQTTKIEPKPETTTQKPQITTQLTTTSKPESTVTWSESMKAWRKLCEGKILSESEQNLIRNEILKYAQNFNGKTDIHVSFGIDEYDISYEKPLNLIIRDDMTDLSYAHMDAYVDADSSWQISNAKDEEEIYEIVCETRSDCLHVIDYGLYNRWEIYSGNDALKYAGDIEFNVGFDGTAIWFLTEDK